MDREEIVKSALELLDEAGLEGVTVRRLAARLGVQNPALYWHFRGKRALLDEMAQALQSRQDFGPPHEGESWRQWFTRRGRERRAILLSHRDGARLVAGTRPGPELVGRFEAELGSLVECGFTPSHALLAIGTLTRFVNGFVLEEQALHQRQVDADGSAPEPPAGAQPVDAFTATPILAAAIRGSGDSDASFDYGLKVVVDGIATSLDNASNEAN
jgi:TetR/AcrR family tetracycline transcriptional repressor